MHHASCLCGAVKITVDAPLTNPDGCHCTACRKTSGHYLVSTDVPKSAVSVSGEENVTWYASSEKVRRGFCKVCGATLFFDPNFQDWTAIAMGAFDDPTGVEMHIHIFVSEKGDYYELKDGLPQNQT